MIEKELTALEAIQKVKETEIRARAILEEARSKEIPEIMVKASEEAKIIVEEILDRARKEAVKRKQIIVTQAKKEAEEIKKDTQQEIEKIEKKAREKFDLAWQAIRLQILKEIEGGRI